jgi:hypothetical protein
MRLCLLFAPDGRFNTFLRNVGQLIPEDTAIQVTVVRTSNTTQALWVLPRTHANMFFLLRIVACIAVAMQRSRARRNMCCLVTAGKHVKNIRAVARQPPMTTIEELLEAMFPLGFLPGLYNEDRRPAQGNWHISVVGCSPFMKDLSAESWRTSTVHIRYQETAVEDIAVWRRLNVCSSES